MAYSTSGPPSSSRTLDSPVSASWFGSGRRQARVRRSARTGRPAIVTGVVTRREEAGYEALTWHGSSAERAPPCRSSRRPRSGAPVVVRLGVSEQDAEERRVVDLPEVDEPCEERDAANDEDKRQTTTSVVGGVGGGSLDWFRVRRCRGVCPYARISLKP